MAVLGRDGGTRGATDAMLPCGININGIEASFAPCNFPINMAPRDEPGGQHGHRKMHQ
jgi:hypothetical protein